MLPIVLSGEPSHILRVEYHLMPARHALSARGHTNTARRPPNRMSSSITAVPKTSDPLWYKDAVIYQLHVKTFADGNGDGIGDFKGLTGKLSYLRDLGVDCLWLLPMYPSPFRDDGYDIADYRSIHPSYGTLDDFAEFLDAAHALRLRVVTELVLNHTSDQHAWFKDARRSRDAPRRDWYVWSDTDDRYAGVRIIFVDTERSNWAWDADSKQYYWHRFFSHQPDLNYDNPLVREEMWNVMKFWLDLGVDGFRVDAVPYLIEREGTSCENLPETHEVLKFLRARLNETLHRPDVAGGSQSVARRCASLLRRW